MYPYPTLRCVRYGPRYLTQVLGTLATDLDSIYLSFRYDRYAAQYLPGYRVHPSTKYAGLGTRLGTTTIPYLSFRYVRDGPRPYRSVGYVSYGPR